MVKFNTNEYPVTGGLKHFDYYEGKFNSELGFERPKNFPLVGHHLDLYLGRLEEILPRGAELVRI